jgi:cellulose synthase/poly-beta-1,6-N-acetylglucosamine synthase-like glycosyltransferase
MKILTVFINILESIAFIYLGFAALYALIFAVAGVFPKKRSSKNFSGVVRKFAVLVPGYKEDNVIFEVACEALKQDYPKDKFDIIIIADSFMAETLEKLKQLPIKLIEVSFEKSTKSKALNKAMEIIDEGYDIALVLDADNIMASDFLKKMNQAFDNGFIAVQGHRVAKNQNTSFAVLDAISEEINNNIFRKGHRNLGLSSALIGSGMAFEYAFFKSSMAVIDAVGGFDKELELKLLKNRVKIEYLNDALVYDEKVQKADVFANQRKRWLSAQLIYFRRNLFSGIYHLFTKGNLDYFDKVYQFISPPRVLLIGLVVIITLIYGSVEYLLGSSGVLIYTSFYWILLLIMVITAFIFSIPAKFYTKETLRSIKTLPKVFFLMFFSLFKLKGANKKFIHTQHGTINNT